MANHGPAPIAGAIFRFFFGFGVANVDGYTSCPRSPFFLLFLKGVWVFMELSNEPMVGVFSRQASIVGSSGFTDIRLFGDSTR